ncbi:MAG: RidA family protein, partial [Dongiaceae bacterium]
IALLFPWVNVRGERVFVSGHGPQNFDGSLAGPFGKVGTDVSIEQAQELARKVGLSILASLQRALGDLDRVAGWARVFGMVNAAPSFDRHPAVINGFSDLILAVFGADIGRHARSAIGVAGLPFNIAVEIEAEVLLR